MHPVFNTQNKEARILSKAAIILDYFVFAKETPKGTDYAMYMNSLASYSQTGKNKHDDAADATAGLAKFCINYLKLFN